MTNTKTSLYNVTIYYKLQLPYMNQMRTQQNKNKLLLAAWRVETGVSMDLFIRLTQMPYIWMNFISARFYRPQFSLTYVISDIYVSSTIRLPIDAIRIRIFWLREKWNTKENKQERVKHVFENSSKRNNVQVPNKYIQYMRGTNCTTQTSATYESDDDTRR